jgi:hypothetical protein
LALFCVPVDSDKVSKVPLPFERDSDAKLFDDIRNGKVARTPFTGWLWSQGHWSRSNLEENPDHPAPDVRPGVVLEPGHYLPLGTERFKLGNYPKKFLGPTGRVLVGTQETSSSIVYDYVKKCEGCPDEIEDSGERLAVQDCFTTGASYTFHAVPYEWSIESSATLTDNWLTGPKRDPEPYTIRYNLCDYDVVMTRQEDGTGVIELIPIK